MLIEILCVLCLMLFTIFPCVSVGILESPTFNWWIIFETLFQVVNIWKTDKCWSSHYYRDYICADVSLSSDFIVGFCGETDEQHRDTLSLMEIVRYDMAYVFAYSMRKVS